MTHPQQDMAPTTLSHYINDWAEKTPERTFFISTDTGDELSFLQLQQHCQSLASQFVQLGYQPGDKVSVFMPNCQTTAVMLLGVMAAGLVVNPINLLAQASQLRHILEHSDTRLVLTTAELAGRLQPLLDDIDREIALVVLDPQAREVPRLLAQDNAGTNGQTLSDTTSPDMPALLMYTSGTTGVPKGVVLTHNNLTANARFITQAHQLTAQDRVLGSLPLFHINALVVTLLTPLIHGGSVAMTPRFSLASFWDDARRYACTWINVVPTIVAYLLNDETPQDTRSLEAIRFCRTASASLPPDHLTRFQQRFGISIIETMGLTETAAPAFSNPLDPAQRRLGSVGKPSGCQARVIDDNGIELADHEHGEIVLSGPQVMLEYYKQPDTTAETFTADGWLRTGDIGYRDSDGYYFIVGRAKELIIKGGENIAPREIDEAIVRHPSVLDAAAVGVPHEEYGQDIAVYLVLRESQDFDEDDLREHCLNELGRYKSPSRFVVVDDLPRGPSGKVQRLKLLDMS